MDTDEILKALAHPKRLEILAWLKEPERHFPGQEHPLDFGVCAGQVERRCDLSQSTVSAHLAVLQRAGLVTTRKVGQWVFYKRDEAAIAAFLATLSHALQAHSSPALQAHSSPALQAQSSQQQKDLP